MHPVTKAAQIMADMFPGPLLRDWRDAPRRRDLYVWEKEALDWLREWRKRDGKTSINDWTAMFMEFGPPPWGEKRTQRWRRAEAIRAKTDATK